jgi:D-lactate dehydrogenase
MNSQSKSLYRVLRTRLPELKVYTQYLDCYAKGTDAGIYRLTPQMVVEVNNEHEVSSLLHLCNEMGIPVTFKAGGTSLSGQTITDSVLIEIGPDFSKHRISGNGELASFQPGVRGARANQLLAPFQRKIGPSPASVNAAKIGGIVANNASGSSYGISTNSYNTIESMRIVLANGFVLDTADLQSRDEFVRSNPELVEALLRIRSEIVSNPSAVEKINQKYQLKNTTGYGINSLLDYSDPVDILMHLMVGSEGTLGFISEVTFRTIEDHPFKACALIYLPDMREAAHAILPLRECEVSAAELMDRNALRSVENNAGMPEELKTLDENVSALLIETSAPNKELLLQQCADIEVKLSGIRTIFPIKFAHDKKSYNTLWKVRKGLFTSAAATRPKGTACIIEDVAFPGHMLADALTALQQLLHEHHYSGTVIWGHLLDGNIHFLVMPDFRDAGEMENYKRFMHNLANLVVNKFSGSLKAEHGTGRNMAPFVEYEWGSFIYQQMKQVKMAFDPNGILNPGVLINDDPEVFAKNIKPLPEAHPLIDDCIECGFCESSCPSRDLTLTPRQRIAVYRQISQLEGSSDVKGALKLKRSYSYSGVESCATDGLCELNCPVGINTGKLVKELRVQTHGAMANQIATLISTHYSTVSSVARNVLSVVGMIQKVIPFPIMNGITRFLHRATFRTIPLWNKQMPLAAPKIKACSEVSNGKERVVYFPACINRMFGLPPSEKDKLPLIKLTEKLLGKANFAVIYPHNINDLCCGMAFDSKGYKAQGMLKLRELERALLDASNNGQYPVLCEMSPCLLRMKDLLDKRLRLYEPVEFCLHYFQDRLEFKKLPRTVTVHSTCSNTKMGLDEQLAQLAGLCVQNVVVPEQTGCCGWAGDKGFSLPELNASALRYLKTELPAEVKSGYSTSRTCEIGLSLHSGITYQSILYLVDEATQAKVL